MAAAHDDDNITFGVLFHAYITAVEEEENQPERRTRRAAVRQFWVRPWLTEVNIHSGGARILEQAGPAPGPKVLW